MTGWPQFTPADYVILGLLLLAFLEGFRRGFLAEAIRFGALIVTLLVAGRYSEPFRLWLNQRWHIEERLVLYLAGRLGLPLEAYQTEAAISPAEAADWLRHLPLPGSFWDELFYQAAASQSGDLMVSPAHLILQQLARGLAAVLSYLTLLLLVGLLVAVAASLLSHLVQQDSLLNTINRTAGGAVKALESALLVTLVVALVAPALAVAGFPWLHEQLAGAALTPYCLRLYDWLWTAFFGPAGGLFFPA